MVRTDLNNNLEQKTKECEKSIKEIKEEKSKIKHQFYSATLVTLACGLASYFIGIKTGNSLFFIMAGIAITVAAYSFVFGYKLMPLISNLFFKYNQETIDLIKEIQEEE